METLAVPEGARPRLKHLYAAYALSRRDLASFVTGMLLTMGLDPDDWNLDTTTMTLTFQESTKAGSNGIQSQR